MAIQEVQTIFKSDQSKEALPEFNHQLYQDRAQPQSVVNAELRMADQYLRKQHILPETEIVGHDDHKKERIWTAGLTAEKGKDPRTRDYVIAVGSKDGSANKAEHVVILAQNGQYYQAQKVEGGYVKTGEPFAKSGKEFEMKCKAGSLPTVLEKAQKGPAEVSPEVRNSPEVQACMKELNRLQHDTPQSDEAARLSLNRLAAQFATLKPEQQLAVRQRLEGNNQDIANDSSYLGRPRVYISPPDADGRFDLKATWKGNDNAVHTVTAQNRMAR